jgi:hypothetical protein
MLALMSMLAVGPLSQQVPAGFSNKHFGQLSAEITVKLLKLMFYIQSSLLVVYCGLMLLPCLPVRHSWWDGSHCTQELASGHQ